MSHLSRAKIINQSPKSYLSRDRLTMIRKLLELRFLRGEEIAHNAGEAAALLPCQPDFVNTVTYYAHFSLYVLSHTEKAYTRAIARIGVRVGGMKRDGVVEEGKERTAGRLGLVCGVEVSVWTPPATPPSPCRRPGTLNPPRPPSHCCCCYHPLTRRGGIGGVRCEGWPYGSILWRVEGVLGRAWHAHTPRREQGWI